MSTTPPIEPDLSDSEAEELAHLEFYRRALESLRERGLMLPEHCAQVLDETAARRAAILRSGEYRAAVARAELLAAAGDDPGARHWAEQARQIDPSRRDAWEFAIRLEWDREQDAEAIALCTSASEHLPEMAGRLAELRVEHRAREEERIRRAELAREEALVSERLARARQACQSRREADAIADCEAILALRPDHIEAIATAAFCQQRRGDLDEALELYDRLCRLQPGNLVWEKWVANVRSRQRARALVGREREEAIGQQKQAAAPREFEARIPPPSLSWSSIAGEFLQEHWQKLILCLAVLLIVVSSTVGAHLMLGDRLWSPLGKCALALVGTVMLAALGLGLVRWGARRAGEMMLVTTLLVVPIHFMLDGQLRLLLEPSPWRLAGFAVQFLVLLMLTRAISGTLLPAREAWWLAGPLMLLSVVNAVVARGAGESWTWRFAAFQVPGLVFLATVWMWSRREVETSAGSDRRLGTLGLGVLGFALATGLVHSGAYVLGLPPTLYGVPVMLAGIACVRGAGWVGSHEPAGRQAALMKLGGHSLAGLAFALALARPLGPSPLLSGNTLAVALLGLGLFVTALRLQRHPAYLYMSFAAFVLAYFGAYGFLRDLIAAVEDAARQALGYSHRLPGPFRAINGLVFNALLGLLALAFARRWNDPRLARHCHFLGLPFSVAACAYSGFEPRAALICLSGYTVLYLAATWVFAAPWVQYLAVAALAGAAHFGSVLFLPAAPEQQSLVAGAAALGCALASLLLHGRGASAPYQAPWTHGSLILAYLAIAAATTSMRRAGAVSAEGALVFLEASLAGAVLSAASREAAWSTYALLCGNIAGALGLVSGNLSRRWGLGLDHYAIAAGIAGLVEIGLGVWSRPYRRDGSPRPILAAYLGPLKHFGLILAALAAGLCVAVLLDSGAGRLLPLAIALAASSTAFAIGSARVYRTEWLAYAAVWAGLGSYACVVGGLIRHTRAATFGVALAAACLLLCVLWRRLKVRHYRGPLLQTALWGTGLVWLIAFATWHAHLQTALALALAAWVLAILAGEMGRGMLVYPVLVSALGVWLKCLDPAVGLGRAAGTLWVGLGATSFELIALGAAEVLRVRSARRPWALTDSVRVPMFLVRIPVFVVVSSFLGDALAWMNLGATGWTCLILLMAAAGLLWATRFMPDVTLVHVGLFHAVAAALDLARWLVPGRSQGMLLGWLALALGLTTLLLWAAGLLARRYRREELYAIPCWNTALAVAAAAFVLAVVGRVLDRGAYLPGAAALALDTLALALISASRGQARLIYAPIATFATATYLVLFSVGKGDPEAVYVLGLAAAIEALVCWCLGDLGRRLQCAWARGCAGPLFRASLVLTVLAIPPAVRSPVTMVLVAALFLLAVKSLPSERWIYPAAAALGAAFYFPWLAQLSKVGLLIACLAGTYALWLLALVVRSGKDRMAARLGLRPLSYELPLFHLAACAGLAALLLKFDQRLDQAAGWTAHPWVPLLLAPPALGLVRAYPRPAPVHLALGLFSLGIISWLAPTLSDPGRLLLAIVVLALGAQLIHLIVRPIESRLERRFDLHGAGMSQAARGWWRALGGIGALTAVALVAAGMAEALIGARAWSPLAGPADWWFILASLLLLGAQVVLLGRDPDLLPGVRPEDLLLGLELTGLAVLWWLGATGSPLRIRSLPAVDYFPLITAAGLLAIADLNERWGRRAGRTETGEFQAASRERLTRITSMALLPLALLAAFLTLGRESLATVATLAVESMALGLWAVRRHELWAGYLGGLAWSAAGLAGGLVLLRWLGPASPEARWLSAAAGVLAAACSLTALAGWPRRWAAGAEEPESRSAAGSLRLALNLALALERVALGGALLAAALTALAVRQPGNAGAGWAALAVGLLLAVALVLLELARRWQAEWPVYLAQASLVGAYAAYRQDHPLSASADAAVLTLFAFVDLGIAEVFERGRGCGTVFARPARYASLALPVLPLVQLIAAHGLGDVTVFHLVASGTFYAVACGTMRWRSLGYAAGVLYNAALWVLWSRMGWQLADHPQFFLVPVGLSAILFAEVNRRELGRSTVNTVRLAGLVTTYLAMAAPIWRFHSFGDWVALLLGSLIGLFAGIGLRVQTFVWLGVVTFVANLVYELGRVSLDHALARWAIMLSLGILLVVFVAVNEKKQVVASMRGYYDEIRSWE